MANKSYLTAITRKKLSNPAKYLNDNNLLKGRTMDYGCGRGFDARALEMDMYDPHYYPFSHFGKYDTVMCNFVLNVIEDENERNNVVRAIREKLTETGIAYITVRADRKRLRGTTSKGTWQGLIELPLPVETKTADWMMYRMTKNLLTEL